MARIAGDDPGYTFRMMRRNKDGSLTASPIGFSLPSVTTIISETVPKPFAAGAWHGYRLALEALEGRDLRAIPDLEGTLTKEGRNPNQQLVSDASRGNVAHDVLELLCAGETEIAEGVCQVELDASGTMYGFAVLAWWRDYGHALRGLRSEVPVFSLRHQFAGTMDLVLAGKEILDLKTHKPAAGFTKKGQGPAYVSDLIQLRAYRMAWEEMGNAPVQRNRIIIARSNGKYLEDDREVPEELWLQCLRMYKLLKTGLPTS